jgi:hypothetical protein
MTAHQAAARRYREEHKARGLCVLCPRKAEPFRLHCKAHRRGSGRNLRWTADRLALVATMIRRGQTTGDVARNLKTTAARAGYAVSKARKAGLLDDRPAGRPTKGDAP